MKYIKKDWIFKTYPNNESLSEKHYELKQVGTARTADEVAAELKDGEIAVSSLYISVDPYHRIQASTTKTWEDPHATDKVQGAAMVGEVVASKCKSRRPGSIVLTYGGWTTLAICSGSTTQLLKAAASDTDTETSTTSEDENNWTVYFDGLSPSYALAGLGMPARTAYFGLLHIGQSKPGETVLVSGAAGAVGSMVCQLAKRHGCTVIGSASLGKHQFLKEIGCDQVLDYRQFDGDRLACERELLRLTGQRGVDVYFDNTGGTLTDAVLLGPDLLRTHGRVVVCGQISQYNALDEPELGPRFLHKLIYNRCRIQGVLARDWTHRHREMLAELAPLVQQKQLHVRLTEFEGFSNIPKSLQSVMSGKNTGKGVCLINKNDRIVE